MNLKYEVGQTVKVEANKTVVELMESEIKSITVCSTGAKYLTSKGAFSEEQLDAFALKAQPIAPQEDKPKYKSGDKARVTGNTNGHCYKIGKIVELCGKRLYNEASGNFYWNTDSSWGFVRERDIEPYAEPEQPKSKYESMNNQELKVTACNMGLCSPSNSNRKEKCPLYHVSEAYGCSEWFDKHPEFRSTLIDYLKNEETPEPEKEPEPVYYSGKVVCTENENTKGFWTVGKVYEFKNGYAMTDCGEKSPVYGAPINALSEYAGVKFIPYLGE